MTDRSGRALTVAAMTVAVAMLLGFAYLSNFHNQLGTLRAGIAEEETRQTRLTGLNNPRVANMLDPRYTDANGDLVADAPTDPAKCIDPPVLKFSYIPQDDNSGFEESFKELLAAISRATGKPVAYADFTSPDDETRAMRDGQLQIAGFNTGAVPAAVCEAGFIPVAEMADDAGRPNYQMEIIVSRTSKMKTIQDLRERELTLTEPTSNSGYKAPLVILRENGLIPPRDYLLRFSQGHVASIAGIKNRQFEAAAVANDVLQREITAGHIARSDFRSIYRSAQSFPSAALGYANNLKPELAAKIKAVVLNFDWRGTRLEKTFGAEGKSQFVACDYKTDWDYVRRIDDSIGFAYRLRQPLALASH